MIGNTCICRWKDNKRAAYSLCADDSLRSQLDFMAPEMLKRGFRGTFWVNPGLGAPPDDWANCWIARKNDWLDLAKAGFDFANHTMIHQGAKTIEEAEHEIKESARVLRECNPNTYLLLFLRGGGTTWLISNEEVKSLLDKYDCVNGRGGGYVFPLWHDAQQVSATEDELLHSVDAALNAGSWRIAAFHGVGPKAEWLPIDPEPFIALVDYLYEKKTEIWVETNTKIHKYFTEYDHTPPPEIHIRENGIAVNIKNELRTDMYDYPLTLTTEVPGNWERCLIIQNGIKNSRPVRGGKVMYEAIPNKGEMILQNF